MGFVSAPTKDFLAKATGSIGTVSGRPRSVLEIPEGN